MKENTGKISSGVKRFQEIIKTVVESLKKKKNIREKLRSEITLRMLRICLGIVVLCMAAFFVLILWSIRTNSTFRETFYPVGCIKLDRNIRIVQLSDLHSSTFGKKNDNLAERVSKLKPDIIIMTGDMIQADEPSMEMFLGFCKRLREMAPVCYIYGDEEISRLAGGGRSEIDYSRIFQEEDGIQVPVKEDGLSTRLEAMGISVLWNDSTTIEVENHIVDVYGILTTTEKDFDNYARKSYDKFIQDHNQWHLKLIVANEPLLFEEVADAAEGADLILCGHTNGDGIRLPRLGALYEKEHGFLPEIFCETALISGEYHIGEIPLIVSDGLSRKKLLRVNNQPELVIVDINRS